MAKYVNLHSGIRVLATDNNSFNVNNKGYNLVRLLRADVSRMPKKADLEDIKCDGVVRNIENLYSAMVKYHSTVSETKAIRKSSLEKIVFYEKAICDSLGMTLRETEDGEVFLTETITINQYNFFEACFSIRHASKKERTVNNNVIDVVTLTTFKKAVLFGLSEACANDGDLYAINGKNAKVLARIDNVKTTNTGKKSKKAEPVKQEVPAELKAICEALNMTIEQVVEHLKAQATAQTVANA